MLLTHLALTHFRNYGRLELDFDRPFVLLQGQNAQGKTNLLEAIFMLATSKPVHAQQEREIVDWHADDEPIPFCRLAAQITAGGRPVEIEIVLAPRGDGGPFVKQVKINGVPKRSMDLIGLLRAVLFLPADIELVSGAPGERRRYLDIALCQIDRAYCRALSSFQQVLTQRNSLLKLLREQDADPRAPAVEAQLAFWDERVAADGATVMARRQDFLIVLERLARACHEELSGGRELLRLHYLPSFNTGLVPDADFEHYQGGLLDETIPAPADVDQIRTRFRQKLGSRRSRELAAGVTLYGPHRDDLRFVANGRDLRTYGSRGQQRSAALAVKLAEVRAMTDATGSAPLLLLDDVMSELDAQRRSTLLAVLRDVPQAIVTTTDWDDFTPEFRRQAQLLTVMAGVVTPATG